MAYRRGPTRGRILALFDRGVHRDVFIKTGGAPAIFAAAHDLFPPINVARYCRAEHATVDYRLVDPAVADW